VKEKIDINAVYVPSQDIVARKIEEELIIVPLAAGVGDMEDDLYSLNETGKAIWERLAEDKSLKEVAKALSDEFAAPPGEIENDVVGLAMELLKRRMIVEIPKV